MQGQKLPFFCRGKAEKHFRGESERGEARARDAGSDLDLHIKPKRCTCYMQGRAKWYFSDVKSSGNQLIRNEETAHLL